MRRLRIRAWASAATGMAVLVAGVVAAGAAPPRPTGSSAVVADVPAPGFPEGIALSGNKMYVASPAQNAQKGDAYVFAFNASTGALDRTYTIPATDPIADHGLVGVALDGTGHLYVADIQRGVVQLDLATGTAATYATLPDLPPCLPLLPPTGPCSPALGDRPPFPNDIAFDGFGNAYVSDSFQATIWRIPPGTRTPEIWFQDATLDGGIGANGVRLTPDSRELCVAVFGPPGSIHCIDMVTKTRRLVMSYPTEGPDNIAFGKSGKLYAALALSNQIAVLGFSQLLPATELQRFSGPAQSSTGSVPWDAPAGVAFDNASKGLRVTNHALVTGLVDPQRFVVFDVFVNDTGYPLHRPLLATVPSNT